MAKKSTSAPAKKATAKKAAPAKPVKKAAARKSTAPAVAEGADPKEHYFLQRFGKSLAIAVAESKITSDDENGPGTKAFKDARLAVRDAVKPAQTFDEMIEASGAESEVVQIALNHYFESLRPGGLERRKAAAGE